MQHIKCSRTKQEAKVFSTIHGEGMYVECGASLIAGLEYGMERWNGKWNVTVNIHSCS